MFYKTWIGWNNKKDPPPNPMYTLLAHAAESKWQEVEGAIETYLT